MNFDDSFAKLIGNEGGLVNDPNDPGGLTKYGISQRAYPGEDIANLTLARAKFLYQRDYWGPAGCDAVPDLLKFDLFDMAVNQGVGTAIRALQYACGEAEDGVLGPLTLQAVQSANPGRLLFRFDAARLVHYSNLPTNQWDSEGRGLVRRIASNMAGVPPIGAQFAGGTVAAS
jgi:lysozyme family protein